MNKKKTTYILISILALNNFSCINEKKNNAPVLKLETSFSIDSTALDNSGKREGENIEPPIKTIFKNLEVDTTKVFGTWSQDPTAPFSDFHINAKSFNVFDFESKSDIPYIYTRQKRDYLFLQRQNA
jgi:hypothetical protein